MSSTPDPEVTSPGESDDHALFDIPADDPTEPGQDSSTDAEAAAAETDEAEETAEPESAVSESDQSESVAPVEPDARLFEAHDLALAALREITPETTIGPPAGYTVEDGGVVSLRFENRLAGYPGWFWTVSVAVVDGSEPTVLETELVPGDGALLAPDWVPWAERLAEYHAAQAALAEAGRDEDAEADLEDVEDLDASDFDDDGSSILHAGDVDGVDIDELADADLNGEEPDDDDSDDDDSDEDADDEDDSDDEDDDFDEEDEFAESDDEEDDLGGTFDDSDDDSDDDLDDDSDGDLDDDSDGDLDDDSDEDQDDGLDDEDDRRGFDAG
ncbi:DUF3027 domain-containing protein [Microbacterium sp. 4R-513]|uniref:DUF3027 domain-containing protein n=1 Tax=Microbacterium sp. 4R-513 TaxID=2567934 RepID=UPI0013E1D9C9|nr:DUF3027 domain-containing protein [Microbacterium sp. 4R-513]QIG40027.1 DUF3027 domain-containing protein [Microbacterium sp. 4R-513]